MKKARYDTVSGRHIFIAVLGTMVLAFLVLISIASMQPAAAQKMDGDSVNKGSENGLKI